MSGLFNKVCFGRARGKIRALKRVLSGIMITVLAAVYPVAAAEVDTGLAAAEAAEAPNAEEKTAVLAVPGAEAPELDGELVSISLDGVVLDAGDPRAEVMAGQVFSFAVTVRNTGTASWGNLAEPEDRFASLLSCDPDLNETFGTYFIVPDRGSHVPPGSEYTFDTHLPAPAEPGEYVMSWRLADWMYSGNKDPVDFYGDTAAVAVNVVPHTSRPPDPAPRGPDAPDISDFIYEGSFKLPVVPISPDVPNNENAFSDTGITLRTVDGERRMLLTTGTYVHSLYEIAIPEPGKIVGSDFSAAPEAELRTVFGVLPKDDVAERNGTLWYDEREELLYWTNIHGYYTTPDFGHIPEFPVLRSARLGAGGVLTEVKQWYFPIAGMPSAYKSFWGGVTGIPDGFAEKYTGGRRLGLGFGGAYSMIQTASLGPSIAAASADMSSDELDFQNIMYYPYPQAASRDGNYFLSGTSYHSHNPVEPWRGTWVDGDIIGSGVFIDLPDKKCYIAFARQAVGRMAYDYGGSNYNSKGQNAWYFYDYETLGDAALGITPNNGLQQYDTVIVGYPYEPTANTQVVAGSCFDAGTRRLYLYARSALDSGGMYRDNVVHVYRVAESGGGDEYSRYDLNKSGEVDLNDLTYALKYFMSAEGDTDWGEAQPADFNYDGVIDVADLVLILANYTIPYYN